MVEAAYQKDRYRRKADTVFPGTKVSRQGHLADIEFETAHHAPKRLHEYRYVFEFEDTALRRHGTAFKLGIVALQARYGFEFQLRHRDRNSME